MPARDLGVPEVDGSAAAGQPVQGTGVLLWPAVARGQIAWLRKRRSHHD
jgi:hypothetical protein